MYEAHTSTYVKDIEQVTESDCPTCKPQVADKVVGCLGVITWSGAASWCGGGSGVGVEPAAEPDSEPHTDDTCAQVRAASRSRLALDLDTCTVSTDSMCALLPSPKP